MDIEPEEVTASDRNDAADYWVGLMEELSERYPWDTEEITRTYEQAIDNLQFLEQKPPWWGFMLDDNGYIWIFDMTFLEMDGAVERGVEIMLLSPEGEYLGRSVLPPLEYRCK